jgi:hypothetical protein
MKFEELFNESIELWPDEVDISDGKEVGNGILFKRLSSVWNAVEVKAKLKGEWYDLMTWIIFANLHDIAKQQIIKNRSTIKKAHLNIDKVKHDLVENLQMDEYSDMLIDFKMANHTSY